MLPRLKSNRQFTHLRHATLKSRPILKFQPLFCDSASGNHRRRKSGRRSAATLGITNAVFLKIGVIGMTGPKRLQNISVIFAALVGVLNQQRNRRSCGFTLIDTAQNLNHVRFLALGHMATGAWTSAVKVGFNAMPGGQPSMTQPMAGPWDSPKLVTAKRVPKVFPLIDCDYP